MALQMLERRLVVAPSEVDNDPFLFSVNNGTIELKTGTLRPSERGDFVTKGTSIYYDPDAKCPTFEAFLNRIFRQHLEVIPFLQRAVGYTLTGSTAEQVMLILHGTGSNGKSTLLNVISDILGDLAKVADSSLLTVNQHEQHPTGLAGLKAARFVSASETGQGCRLNESLIKWLTGGDVITARLMRKDFFTFTPQFKIWLGTNHKPTVRGQDHGVWRRLLLIPFDERIEGAERDPSLPQKLKAEFPGILNWALEGCRMWLADGLQPPVVVTNQTEIYKLEQDVFGRFLLETFDLLDGAVTPASECYRRYADWCGHNREFCLNNTQFGLTLAERGFRKTRQSRGMAYLGLRPKPAESVSQRENSPPYDD
jgi:putative DNA primase/helicase